MNGQRRREIAVELLHDQGEVSVAELSNVTGVSPMTIRRDLEDLERQGALRRVYGGAISLASRSFAEPYALRINRHVEAKQRIGDAAAALLSERETVILDIGSTTLQVARALAKRRNLTVLTPSMHIAQVLVGSPGIQLMLTGGIVVPGELSLVGDAAEQTFSHLRFDTFVMGVGGIEAEAGVTEHSLEDARVKRAALATVRRCIVVADSSKLGRVTFARICHLDQVHIVVTDNGATQEDVTALESAHVEVVVV